MFLNKIKTQLWHQLELTQRKMPDLPLGAIQDEGDQFLIEAGGMTIVLKYNEDASVSFELLGFLPDGEECKIDTTTIHMEHHTIDCVMLVVQHYHERKEALIYDFLAEYEREKLYV
jgi:hypothetical protein